MPDETDRRPPQPGDGRRSNSNAGTRPVTGGGSAAQHHEEDDGFGAKALIVGDDHPGLRQAAKMIGFMPVFIAAPQQARDYFMQEYPPVVMLNPAQVTPPPLADFAPIIALTPVDRRKAFFILFSDNLRTLDGNAAFLYGVNLVVALEGPRRVPADLPRGVRLSRAALRADGRHAQGDGLIEKERAPEGALSIRGSRGSYCCCTPSGYCRNPPCE